MEIDRETRLQIAVSVGAVLVFVVGAVAVASSFTTNGHLSTQGGIGIVGVMTLFVLVMAAAGVWLERQEF